MPRWRPNSATHGNDAMLPISDSRTAANNDFILPFSTAAIQRLRYKQASASCFIEANGARKTEGLNYARPRPWTSALLAKRVIRGNVAQGTYA